MEQILYEKGCASIDFQPGSMTAHKYLTTSLCSVEAPVQHVEATFGGFTAQVSPEMEISEFFRHHTNQKAQNVAEEIAATGMLRLLVASRPSPPGEKFDRLTLRMTRPAFDTACKELRLPKTTPLHFSNATYALVPFNKVYGLPSEEDGLQTAIFQTPCRSNGFFSLAVSYDITSNTTSALLVAVDSGYLDLFLNRIKSCGDAVTHPMCLPMLLYLTWHEMFNQTKNELLQGIHQIQNSTDVIKYKDSFWSHLRTPGQKTLKLHDAHHELVALQDRTTGSHKACMTDFRLCIDKCFKSLDTIPQPTFSSNVNVSLRKTSEELAATSQVLVRSQERYEQKLECQHKVLYHIFQQRDSVISHKIASDSQKIAANQRHDSAAMKAISLLTMLFLPATAIATIFSMGQFFEITDNKIATRPCFWQFWAFAVPITFVVVVSWLAYLNRYAIAHVIHTYSCIDKPRKKFKNRLGQRTPTDEEAQARDENDIAEGKPVRGGIKRRATTDSIGLTRSISWLVAQRQAQLQS